MVLKGLLKNYYDFCESHVKKHKKGFEDKTKREKLELNFLKKIEEQSLVQNSDKDRKIHIESELKKHTKKLDAALVAEKNLRKKNIITDFQILNHHTFIKKVEVKDNCLDIYTTELKVEGHDIGNYLIRIPIREPFGDTLHQIRIANLKKRVEIPESDSIFDHWFVKNEIPCFGQWAHDINNYLLKGNLSLAVSNLIHFLLSIGTDGHLQVNQWLHEFSGEEFERANSSAPIEERDTEQRDAQRIPPEIRYIPSIPPIPPTYHATTAAIDTGEDLTF